jgi:hypothetical protein
MVSTALGVLEGPYGKYGFGTTGPTTRSHGKEWSFRVTIKILRCSRPPHVFELEMGGRQYSGKIDGSRF